MSGAEALARRDRIAGCLDRLGCDTEELGAATTEHDQVVGLLGAINATMSQLWVFLD